MIDKYTILFISFCECIATCHISRDPSYVFHSLSSAPTPPYTPFQLFATPNCNWERYANFFARICKRINPPIDKLFSEFITIQQTEIKKNDVS